MSAHLVLSRNCHTFFVWFPAEQSKVITMGALLNKYRLIFLNSKSGLSALWSWKSARSSSASTEHKATPKSSCRFSLDEADFALWQALELMACFRDCSRDSLLIKWDWENSLGSEREKIVGEKGITFELCLREGCLDGDCFGGGELEWFLWSGVVLEVSLEELLALVMIRIRAVVI